MITEQPETTQQGMTSYFSLSKMLESNKNWNNAQKIV